jgi:hypothetical protein
VEKIFASRWKFDPDLPSFNNEIGARILRTDIAMDVEHDRSAIEDPSAERLPEVTLHSCGDGKQKHSGHHLREGNLSLDCSRFARKKIVVNSAQTHQIHSYMRISTGCRRKPIASVKRNVDLGQYVVK